MPVGKGVGEGGGSGGPAERAEVEKAGKKAGAYRLEDTRLDGKLPAWPAEPPTAAKNNLERTRLALIGSPGEVHRLGWRLSDVGRASALAAAFARAKPAKLYPGATGVFEARAYFDPETRKWRVAARYVAGQADVPLGGLTGRQA